MRFRDCVVVLWGALAAWASIAVLTPARASAWDFFRSENGDVQSGNERMAADDPAGAVVAYDRAAAALPSEGGVHLNRGLALLAQEELDAARESFERAQLPPASDEVRAAASYDLGIAFYRQADAAANEEDHQNATRLFREAADAFRASLRHRPGNRDAGWNLELALRRIVEEREAQEQQEQENQDQEDQENQDEQDGENQDQDQDGQDNPEDQDGENQEDSQSPDDSSDSDSDQDSQDGQEEEPEPQDEGESDQPEESDESDEPEDESTSGSDSSEEESGERELPSDARRVLDALENNERSLEQERAQQRAGRERRRVLQDW